MSVAVGDFSQEVTSENPTGEEKLFIDKIGDSKCKTKRQEQARNVGGRQKEASVGRAVGNERRGVRSYKPP